MHDVFVLPSLNEGMSNTVLEAMATGMPILMTRTGGAQELVEPGDNGDFIEADGAGIARSIKIYLERPALIRTHGARSRAKAEARGWAEVAAAYTAHYSAASRVTDRNG
jgi:glycosyltransferase involved in cell wall biosynthesis